MKGNVFKSPFRLFNDVSIKDPYLIMIRDKYLSLEKRLKDESKILIRLSIAIIVSTIIRVLILQDYFILAIIPLYIGWLFISFKRVVNSIPLSAVSKLLKSDKFIYEGINDEELFRILNILWSGEGKLYAYSQMSIIPFFFIIIYHFIFVVLHLQIVISSLIFS